MGTGRTLKIIPSKAIDTKIKKICEANDIIFMALFGSYVKGEHKRNSDIDIAIEFDENSRKSLLDLIRIEYELRKIFRRKIDLGIFSAISPYIIERVKEEMRVIYER